MIQVALLAVAALVMLMRPGGVPVWFGPFAAAIAVVAFTTVSVGDAADALEPLRSPLLFLVFAVPLAVTLDDVGIFAAGAALVDGGRHLAAGLWVFAALVVVVFNLDAAVMLLTPLYVRIARRHGYPPEALAFQPALLACIASGVLPVSNLTNLVVAEHWQLDTVDFVRAMLVPTVAACVVGFVAYRLVFDVAPRESRIDEHVPPGVIRRGGPVVGFVLVGFVVAPVIGVEVWLVAALAWVWASLVARRVRWQAVPVGALVVAASLAVLVAGATPHLGLDDVFAGSGALGDLRLIAFGTVSSNLVNNLPTVLYASSSLERIDQVWPLLVGVNVGAVLTMTGSLSGLLWRDTARRVGLEVGPARYAVVGCLVGLPALAIASVAVIGR